MNYYYRVVSIALFRINCYCLIVVILYMYILLRSTSNNSYQFVVALVYLFSSIWYNHNIVALLHYSVVLASINYNNMLILLYTTGVI